MKGEFKLDKVIFRNITSSNDGSAILICCFSSNICITNCGFDRCKCSSFNHLTHGGAIFIIGHNTLINITNVIGENCSAYHGHFSYIYSNYPTSITKTTIIKCSPNLFSDKTTIYSQYDNIFNSCNISKNSMSDIMIDSYQNSEFIDCIIASNRLVKGSSYIKSSLLSLTRCFIYNNTHSISNNKTISTFEYDDLELNDCYLLIESSYNFSNSNVTNCSINNNTYEYVHDLAISKQIGCNTKLVHVDIKTKFAVWKIIVIILSAIILMAIISVFIIKSQNIKYKRLQDRKNIDKLVMNDFG